MINPEYVRGVQDLIDVLEAHVADKIREEKTLQPGGHRAGVRLNIVSDLELIREAKLAMWPNVPVPHTAMEWGE